MLTNRPPILTTEQLIERLERAGETVPAGSPIAFDADGTLWSGDIGVDTFEAMIERGAIRKEAQEALHREAHDHGIAIAEEANQQARILNQAYLGGRYPEERAFRVMAWAFAGYETGEVAAFASEVIAKVGLQARLHAEILPIVDWAHARAIPTFVVSASLGILVETAVATLGLATTKVFAMTPAIENGVVLDRVVEPATYGHGKVLALRHGAPGATLYAAFGDSAFDLEMLCEARVPVSVRPKPELLARRGTCPGLLELAPRIA